MTLTKVAEGGVGSLFSLAAYEGEFPEGSAGELLIATRWSVPATVVEGIDKALRKAHVDLIAPVTSSDGVLRIQFKKGMAVMGSIAVVLGVFFLGTLLLMVTGWTLFRGTGGVAGILTGGLGLIALAVVGMAIMGARSGTKK